MIDFNSSNTFVLNLKCRPQRLQSATKELSRRNIDFTVWDATKNDNGRLGLIQTMMSLFSFVIVQKLNYVTVFEDDVKLLHSPKNYLQRINEQLPKNWHLFYWGCNLSKPPQKLSENVLHTKSAYATHAVTYNLPAIELIMAKIESAAVYDIFLVEKIQSAGHSFAAYPLMASQFAGNSDVEKKWVNYERFLERRFQEQTKHL